jgi:surface antigen
MTAEAIKNGYKMDVAPKVGDMVVFKNGSFYGSHGHVGLVIGTSGDRYLVAEQNFMNSNPSLLSGWGSWDIRSIGWPDAQASGFIASPPSR